jgi:hypothetical protein
MHNYEIPISQTASSGTWSFNTGKLVSGYLKQILVKATTAITTFGFRITDYKNNVVFQTETYATGTLRQEVEIPLREINTIEVFGSSAEEAFTGKLVFVEH